MLSFLELETLAKLSNRHFLHQAVATSLCWIKTFSALNRNLLKLTDLANQFHPLGKLGSLLILALLETLLQVTVHFISNCFVLKLLVHNGVMRSLFV